ncbi:TPA: hypothetical protein N0F65_010545 [Lagenidium giganteum]|uniref:Rab-GAP TBC domain-containing protein n=1 Tax=Lagenidium giganteum TaxID=4803 RepID=A0AAV2ZDP2_9STRA|nr:TPA: hypothetical protein N0F65_010545 [Lagenidium giganteum]
MTAARKKRTAGAGRRAKGVPGRARVERTKRETEMKQKQLAQWVHRLHMLEKESPGSELQPEDAEPTADEDKPARPHCLSEDSCNGLACRDTVFTHEELFQELRTLALTRGGVLTHAMRKEIWPFFLGHASAGHTHSLQDQHKLPVMDSALYFAGKIGPHREDDQIEKDVERSLWHYDVVKTIRESDRRTKRRSLTWIINSVLRTDPELHYYQGYHDICSVFLLVTGDQAAYPLVLQVSETYMREGMRSNFDTVLNAIRMLFPLIQRADEELYDHIQESGVEPFFALPWMITWFAHHLQRFDAVARLYDAFLCSHPLFSLYVSAAVVLDARQRVLSCECDFGTMHNTLSKLPYVMDVERVLEIAIGLFEDTPPGTLVKISAMENVLMSSSYFQFPYVYQQQFGVEKPLPVVPNAFARHKRYVAHLFWAVLYCR